MDLTIICLGRLYQQGGIYYHTQDEAQYTFEFCDAVVHEVMNELRSTPLAIPEHKVVDLKLKLAAARRASAAAAGKQRRTFDC